MTTITGVAAATTATVELRERLSRRAELVTMLLGTWLMVGLFVDGWAHNNLDALETFFTPWHALFYSGFGATAAWIGWQVLRRQDAGHRGLTAVPLGYGLAAVGLVVFVFGAAGDLVWHEVLGIEQGIEALFSPTHLLLFVGILLVVSSPLRAAWAADTERAPSFRAFLPVVLSATLVTTLVAFMFMFWSASMEPDAAAPLVAWSFAQDTEEASVSYLMQSDGLASVLATNLVLLAPVLLLVRRWRPPLGTVTVLFTTVAVLTGAVGEFSSPAIYAAYAAGGLGADLLLRRLRPSPSRPQAYWAAGLAVPLVLWSAYFAVLALTDGIGWTAEMWTGSILWASLLGGALAVLMLPPAVPAAQGTRAA